MRRTLSNHDFLCYFVLLEHPGAKFLDMPLTSDGMLSLLRACAPEPSAPAANMVSGSGHAAQVLELCSQAGVSQYKWVLRLLGRKSFDDAASKDYAKSFPAFLDSSHVYEHCSCLPPRRLVSLCLWYAHFK